MNNIAGFIQPSVFAQPSVMPVMQPPVSIISSGGRSDIMTMAVVSAVVFVLLIIIYRHIQNNNIAANSEEPISETFDQKRERLEDMDALARCGWEVYVMDGCPWCVRQKSVLAENFPNFKNIYNNKPATAFPTWYNTRTGETKMGFQSLESLKALARC